MKTEELQKILDAHKKWLDSARGKGKRAYLLGANLRDANLLGADLRDAYLSGTNLEGANLKDADLEGADLRNANLNNADLEGANLQCADLWGANLMGADLEGANLQGADFRNAIGNMQEIKSGQIEGWPFTYTSSVLSIGCQAHPIARWWDFSDEEIVDMDPKALNWWRKWRPVLKQIIEMSPAGGN